MGGPLQTVNTRSCMFTQIGVTKSLMKENMSKDTSITNLYARVTAYLDWIEQEVWGNETVPVEAGFADNGGVAPTIVDPNDEVDQAVTKKSVGPAIVRSENGVGAISEPSRSTSDGIIHFPNN